MCFTPHCHELGPPIDTPCPQMRKWDGGSAVPTPGPGGFQKIRWPHPTGWSLLPGARPLSGCLPGGHRVGRSPAFEGGQPDPFSRPERSGGSVAWEGRGLREPWWGREE